MQLIGRGQPAGEFAVPVDVVRIDHITDAHLGSDRLRPFVDAAADASVGMAIDETGRDVLAGPVDALIIMTTPFERAGSDRGDLAIDNGQPAVLDDTARSAGPDGCIGNQD